MTAAARKLSDYTHWLVRDKVDAAGRIGLYRVYFTLFYLWRLCNFQTSFCLAAEFCHWKQV